jgi:hypothetical protein
MLYFSISTQAGTTQRISQSNSGYLLLKVDSNGLVLEDLVRSSEGQILKSARKCTSLIPIGSGIGIEGRVAAS